MSERNVYRVPEDKVLLRTADVYQTEAQDDVDSYSDSCLPLLLTSRIRAGLRALTRRAWLESPSEARLHVVCLPA